jgi:LysM repeat protein
MEGQVPRGSPASLDRQNAQAQAHDFSILQTPSQVRQSVESGYLVRVEANSDFDLHQVSYPYGRPAVKVFVERLASQYRSACGEKLVVTSLTRPASDQPANASSRSVHPTGMAVDLRRSGSARCRSWLESTLVSLQSQGVLEAIYETNPVHYHLALFPDPYIEYLARLGAPTSTEVVATRIEVVPSAPLPTGGVHRVVRGENLTAIATRFGVTLAQLRAENGLRSDKILVGQQLRIPGAGPVAQHAVASGSTTPSSGSIQATLPPEE